MRKTFTTLVLITFLWLPVFAQKPIKDLEPTVILISLDGFRYDYIDKFNPPTLNKLAKNGVRARWMIPSFPTKTFPNHYTIATGIYPENHGIIENNIYDPKFDAVFTLGKREEVQNGRWWLGEPIWVTAEKQGQKAGAFFYPGTEAPIQGIRPTFWKGYDGEIPNQKRVDTVLGWLDLPKEKRPTIFTMYFSDVDDAGHSFSPDAEETKQTVLQIDGIIKRLFDGLTKRKIDKKVNLIIVSDHGMATVKPENSIVLDNFYDEETVERILWTSEIVQIFPKKGYEEIISENLKSIKNARCWRKSEIPERFHFQKSPRIAPIVCSADEGWYLTSLERLEERKKRADYGKNRGAHGYDNQYQSMQATFIAHGKAFKKGKIVEPFQNIHVYNLMCKILGLKPAENDGDERLVKSVLKNSKTNAKTIKK